MGQDCTKLIMEQILGDVVEMSGIEDNVLDISALGQVDSTVEEDDDTTVQRDDATRDYAAGYTVTIQRLLDLNAKTTNTCAVVQEIKIMVVDLAHSVNNLNDTFAVLKNENVLLRTNIEEISRKQDTMIVAGSLHNPDGSDIVESQVSSSTHTHTR